MEAEVVILTLTADRDLKKKISAGCRFPCFFFNSSKENIFLLLELPNADKLDISVRESYYDGLSF